MWPLLNKGGSRSKADVGLTLEPSPFEAGKVELLSAMDIFQDLAEPEIEALMSDAPMLTARKGTRFYGAEDGPEVLFLLKSGRVELYRESPDGKKLTLAVVERGTFFGEMSLVGQRLVGTCAVALEDSVIWPTTVSRWARSIISMRLRPMARASLSLNRSRATVRLSRRHPNMAARSRCEYPSTTSVPSSASRSSRPATRPVRSLKAIFWKASRAC